MLAGKHFYNGPPNSKPFNPTDPTTYFGGMSAGQYKSIPDDKKAAAKSMIDLYHSTPAPSQPPTDDPNQMTAWLGLKEIRDWAIKVAPVVDSDDLAEGTTRCLETLDGKVVGGLDVLLNFAQSPSTTREMVYSLHTILRFYGVKGPAMDKFHKIMSIYHDQKIAASEERRIRREQETARNIVRKKAAFQASNGSLPIKGSGNSPADAMCLDETIKTVLPYGSSASPYIRPTVKQLAYSALPNFDLESDAYKILQALDQRRNEPSTILVILYAILESLPIQVFSGGNELLRHTDGLASDAHAAIRQSGLSDLSRDALVKHAQYLYGEVQSVAFILQSNLVLRKMLIDRHTEVQHQLANMGATDKSGNLIFNVDASQPAAGDANGSADAPTISSADDPSTEELTPMDEDTDSTIPA
ncbi:hypothetical protein C8J56DRAFT_1039014 [Mycena floridula]|nr:hypothetical protein C8J56DRAFT_1039014 [Mycena floridula]